MNITLSRAALLQAVQRCQSIVEKRHTIPILANVLLQADGNMLHITATDLEVGIRSQAEAQIQSSGSVTVSARKLFDIIKELDPEQDVSLETGDAFIAIRSGRSRFRLSTLTADEYPSMNEDEVQATITLTGTMLSDMVAATSFAMSSDETRKYLTGTLIEVDDQQMLRLVTTDGHRLALSEVHLEQSVQAGKCIVPRKAIMEMRKLCDECPDQIELSLGDRQVRLVAGSNILTSKLIDARFPVYQDVIPSGNPAKAVMARGEFDQVLRRSMIVANEFTHDVRLNFSDQGLDISAHNTEQEEAEEHIAADYSGQDVAIGFNGRYLRDTLGAIRSASVRLELKDELSPVLVCGDDNSGSRYVIMPMRI
ncbi:DNA polymerase III subunit beta [Mariprofundus micogutta]|uniref:Beta sliding clamp n=1 Tax=Mariprofundus micogutta TaxID=1921010 RepID=A0A1L8CQ47_9PROT|nr:DNA polymerase III subunit beta [Mariprofundus micogutta]GAV21038.1 DNA polymerase III subunit beta [Mariprofundus micogutta]